MKRFTKTTLKRALRTFLQAVIGFVATTGVSVMISNDYRLTENLVFGLIGSALAAGIAAIMNLEEVNQILDDEEIESDEEVEAITETETEVVEDVGNQ